MQPMLVRLSTCESLADQMRAEAANKDIQHQSLMRSMDARIENSQGILESSKQECTDLAIRASSTEEKCTQLEKYNKTLVDTLGEFNSQCEEMNTECKRLK